MALNLVISYNHQSKILLVVGCIRSRELDHTTSHLKVLHFCQILIAMTRHYVYGKTQVAIKDRAHQDKSENLFGC
jgi:hypothetical protein